MEETERSLHDAIMIVRRAIKNDSVVAGRFLINIHVCFLKPVLPLGHIIKAAFTNKNILGAIIRYCYYSLSRSIENEMNLNKCVLFISLLVEIG